ncbi:MAG: DNA-directed DNA polymerase II small subunit [Nitrososphaerota archaeon]|jgi:DNA polymerase II small subunit|uniref:DNA-directed DNA polymerase II small subunit n=1 Tax=Candidatus Bathycorpusculum sp. TaxID=2994959 RepID=UPI00282A227E|nr:DNA-directed DNA polymerase II small subunit [Candidatus Termitimicrobium sp.]MCL2431357.1 DNA-directed DNA polymerase II small subunit [Candidatus Termitimicrobium sp.]MDR0493141.1 DNA-directed DNA polymerase II small subunit [Nitrososphaerota archaeon]
MSIQDKLQRAIETTIAAGYQLNSEAFEFLIQNAETSDPIEIMNLALQKIEALTDKPMFIERTFLEAVIQQAATVVQETVREHMQKALPASEANYTESTVEPRFNGLDSDFYPYAKYIPSEFKILDDATGKLTSNGTLGEYKELFQDRFKRLEKILRQRMDVKAATPLVEALKSQPQTKLKVICMLTEKRDSKNSTILSVEDLSGNATILVPLKAPEEVKKKALMLLADTIFCAAVVKTKTNLLMAEDIIFPEVGRKIPQHAQEPVYAVFTSDIHIGSTKFNKEAFKRFILWLRGKYGTPAMREIAGSVKYLLIAGDIVDGVGIYPGQQAELTIRDIHKQYNFATKYLEKIPSYIEIVLSPGNHDAARKSQPQPAIPEDYLSAIKDKPNIHSVGSPCYLSLHGIEVLMFHGVSLNDIIGVVPGMDNDHPEKSMKLLVQCRHLAPVYGGKTMLSPENRDYLVIDKVPDIFHAGHIHVNGLCNYRGVLVVNSGGWQEQTEYMEKLGLVPTPGKVPVINLQTREIAVLDFLNPLV